MESDPNPYIKTSAFYKQALTLREKILGSEHPLVATTLMLLAGNYHQQGDYSQAEQLRQQALVVLEKTLDPKHLDIAEDLNNSTKQLY